MPLAFLATIMALHFIRAQLSTLPVARLAPYAFPLACCAFLLARQSVRAGRILRPVHMEYFRPLLLAYAAILGGSILVLTLTHAHARFLQESVFILAPLITSGVFFAILPSTLRVHGFDTFLVVSFIGIYLLTANPTPGALMKVFDWDVFRSSSIPTESGFAFPLGMLTVYCVTRRKWMLAAVTGACLLLSYKRIALAGTIVALAAFWILSSSVLYRRTVRKLIAASAVLANLMLLFSLLQFGQGKFDRQIDRWFDVPANQFTLGRRDTQGQVLDGLNVPQDPLGLLASLPKGLGTSSEYMVRSRVEPNPRASGGSLHSDLLKILIEFGLIGFVAWIYVFYRLHSFSRTTLALAVYWNVLWITDNTLIYIDTAFVFYMLVGLTFVENQHTPSGVFLGGHASAASPAPQVSAKPRSQPA